MIGAQCGAKVTDERFSTMDKKQQHRRIYKINEPIFYVHFDHFSIQFFNSFTFGRIRFGVFGKLWMVQWLVCRYYSPEEIFSFEIGAAIYDTREYLRSIRHENKAPMKIRFTRVY